MASGVSVTILGTAQDGGIPQAGCSCQRCLDAHRDLKLRKYPVSLGILGVDGTKHIIEITKNLSEQLHSDMISSNPYKVLGQSFSMP